MPQLIALRELRLTVGILLLMALLLGLLRLTEVQPREVRLISSQGAVPITLPFQFPIAPAEAVIAYRGVVERGLLAPPRLRIWGDDCLEQLEIDDRPIPLPADSRCNWQRGFVVEDAALTAGDHRFALQVRNIGGNTTLNLGTDGSPSPWRLRTWLQAALILLPLLLLGRWLRRSDLTPALGWMLMGSLLLQLALLLVTPPQELSYDVEGSTGHLGYVRYILENHALPSPLGGWEFHQPPLYYLAGAAIYGTAQATGLADPGAALQFLSLCLFGVFLFASLRALELLLPDRRLLLPIAAVLLFWPSGVIHSIRIGNDVASYALFALTLLHLLRWHLGEQQRAFGWAVLFATLALLTKSSGLTLFALIGLALLYRTFIEHAEPRWPRRLLLLGAGAGAAFLLGYTDNLLAWLDNPQSDLLMGDAVRAINPGLAVDGSAAHFFAFDPKSFFGEPFTDTWRDGFGRQEFWNFLMKSSLFGEFAFQFPGARPLALLMGDLLLAMALFTLAGILLMQRSDWKRAAIPLVYLMLGLALLIAFKSRIPISSHGDFRLIYPLLLPLLYFHALATTQAEAGGRLVPIFLGRALPLALAAASLLFFLLHIRFAMFG